MNIITYICRYFYELFIFKLNHYESKKARNKESKSE